MKVTDDPHPEADPHPDPLITSTVRGSGSVSHKYGSYDPDPLVTSTDPRIWIRTKMSRIPNTGKNILEVEWYRWLQPQAVISNKKSIG